MWTIAGKAVLNCISKQESFVVSQVWFQNRRAKFRRNERAMLASKNASLLKSFSGEVTAVEQPIVPRPAPRPNDYLSWGSSPSYRLVVSLKTLSVKGCHKSYKYWVFNIPLQWVELCLCTQYSFMRKTAVLVGADTFPEGLYKYSGLFAIYCLFMHLIVCGMLSRKVFYRPFVFGK